MPRIDVDWTAEIARHRPRVVAAIRRRGLIAQEVWVRLVAQIERPGFLALDEVRRARLVAGDRLFHRGALRQVMSARRVFDQVHAEAAAKLGLSVQRVRQVVRGGPRAAAG